MGVTSQKAFHEVSLRKPAQKTYQAKRKQLFYKNVSQFIRILLQLLSQDVELRISAQRNLDYFAFPPQPEHDPPKGTISQLKKVAKAEFTP